MPRGETRLNLILDLVEGGVSLREAKIAVSYLSGEAVRGFQNHFRAYKRNNNV
jgi:hypothetical protein